MAGPDLLARLDAAIRELQAIRAELDQARLISNVGAAAEFSTNLWASNGLDTDLDFRPENLIKISTAVERFNRPADSLRIPFLLGLIGGIAGYFLRRHMLETAPVERRKRAPIVETLHDHWRIVIGFVGSAVFSAVGFYVSFVYLVPNALSRNLSGPWSAPLIVDSFRRRF
jgi:hypothetical protein